MRRLTGSLGRSCDDHPTGIAVDAAIAAIAILLTVAGCGNNEVVLHVDILSFVAPEEQTGAYVAPPGLVTPPQTIEPQAIALPEGVAGVMAMERIEIDFGIDFAADAQSGDGSVEVRLYLAGADSAQGGSGVYQTVPVYTGTANLQAGTTTQHTGQIVATEGNGLLRIFEGGELTLGLALVYDASGAAVPVNGQWTLRRINALVRGRGQAF